MWGNRFVREPTVTDTERTLWFQPGLDDPEAPSNQGDSFKPAVEARGYTEEEFIRPERQLVNFEQDANLISSFTKNGMHKPTLDIDVPARLVPSKTPGHYHLFFEVEMDFDTYSELLWALAKAGIVEPNYVQASNVAGMSFVRSKPSERPDRSMTATEVAADLSAGKRSSGYRRF
jgi:hypothetical protein